MNPLISGNDILNYNFSKPEGRQCRCCVIFVHAADGNMLGPHRMFVELERVLNREGFATMRFDLAGCGDSFGESEYSPNRDISNVNDVIRFLSDDPNIKNIVLLGISRGAYTIYKYLQKTNSHANGVIFLSLPVTSGTVLKKTFFNRLNEYVIKLFSKKTYEKIIRNRVNYKLVFRTLFQPFFQSRNYSVKTTDNFPDIPVLMVYGEKDPIVYGSKTLYLPLFESLSKDVSCKIIENSNHSFFHYKWKAKLIEEVSEWLKARF